MKRIWFLWMVLLLVVALCACAVKRPTREPSVDSSSATTESGTASGVQPSGSAASGSPSSVVSPTGPATAWISTDAAKQIALSHAKLSADAISYYHIEREMEDGVPQYEIEFIAAGDAYDYDIHGVKGTILKAEQNDKNILISNAGQSFITAEQAKNAAFAHAGVPASAVVYLQVELDMDDAIPRYEVEFTAERYEYEYAIHAQTGVVIQYEKEQID